MERVDVVRIEDDQSESVHPLALGIERLGVGRAEDGET
jgi:hypothetical protein